jgi:hypothetical protein
MGLESCQEDMEPPTMLTKAERNTRVMVNTPTRVLFILDRTIFLERVCSGVGKSWGKGGEGETDVIAFSEPPHQV